MLTLPAARMAAFIFSRKWRKASRVCGASLIRQSYLLDDDFAYHAVRLVDRAVVGHGSGGRERMRVERAARESGLQDGAGIGSDRVLERRHVLPADLLARRDENALRRERKDRGGAHDDVRTLAVARRAAAAAPV